MLSFSIAVNQNSIKKNVILYNTRILKKVKNIFIEMHHKNIRECERYKLKKKKI